MEIIKLKLTSNTPLLLNNVRLASPTDSITRRIAALNAKRTRKTDEDRAEVRMLEFAGGLYYDPEPSYEDGTLRAERGLVYLPAVNIFRCLQEAAVLTRDGKNFDRGVIADPGAKPLLDYDGPTSVLEMYNDPRGRFVDSRMVGVGGKKVERTRPIFREWAAEITFHVNPKIIDLDDFVDISRKGGLLIGMGNYRSRGGGYGRFNVETI